MPATAAEVQSTLQSLADPKLAEHALRFFKTGPGEYGEGDRFLGIRVPQQRQVAKQFRDLPAAQSDRLLKSPWHEERLTALLILVDQFRRGTPAEQEQIYRRYLGRTRYINNWDLVDSSAAPIVGGYLADKDRQPLTELAQSNSLWERRIAIIATHYFTLHGDGRETLRIAKLLLTDDADLIHKAVGWMLREVAKRDEPLAEKFLVKHHRRMPRTMLRYAIERFPEPRRQAYMKGSL